MNLHQMKRIAIFCIPFCALFLLAVGAGALFGRIPVPQANPDPKLSILLPLYQYPSAQGNEWDQVALAGKRVQITAIINPNNGPDGGAPNNEYKVGIRTLRTAGVTLIGYVATNYGKRPLAAVKADIDIYAAFYDINGIFIDETAQTGDSLPYYADLSTHIRSKPALTTIIFNPGTPPDRSYISTMDHDIFTIFESDEGAWSQFTAPTYVEQYPLNRFAALIYDVPTTERMRAIVDNVVTHHIGVVYVTNRSFTDDPWNKLPIYWEQLIEYVEHINQQGTSTSVTFPIIVR